MTRVWSGKQIANWTPAACSGAIFDGRAARLDVRDFLKLLLFCLLRLGSLLVVDKVGFLLRPHIGDRLLVSDLTGWRPARSRRMILVHGRRRRWRHRVGNDRIRRSKARFVKEDALLPEFLVANAKHRITRKAGLEKRACPGEP